MITMNTTISLHSINTAETDTDSIDMTFGED